MRRMMTMSLVFGMLVTPPGVAFAAASGGSGPDEFECSAMVSLELAPGIQATPTSGYMATPEPMDLTCSGVLDGQGFEATKGRLSLSGSYGDGPISGLSGGATCSHNDGYLDVTVELPLLGGMVTLTEDDYYWERWAALVIRGEDEFAGAESSQLLGMVTERYGRCTPAEPITGVKVDLDISFVGDLRYSFERPNAAPSTSIVAPTWASPSGLIDIVATLTDEDGASDVETAAVVITSRNGQTVESWDLSSFVETDAHTLILSLDDYRLSGPAPWTLSVSATDSFDHTAHEAVTVERSN